MAARGIVKTRTRIEKMENLTEVFREMAEGKMLGRVVLDLQQAAMQEKAKVRTTGTAPDIWLEIKSWIMPKIYLDSTCAISRIQMKDNAT